MIEIYVSTFCPFCHKVLDFAEEHGIKVQIRNIQDKKHLDKLLKEGGVRQVPFLIDTETDTKMYESSDIVKYLKKKHNIK